MRYQDIIKPILLESASPVIYHATSFSTSVKIMNDRKFRLMRYSREADIARKYNIDTAKFPYYLCTTYDAPKCSYMHNMEVLFKINGNFLNSQPNTYSTTRVHFFNDFDDALGPLGQMLNKLVSEYEERIYCSNEYIPLLNVVLSIHILIHNSERNAPMQQIHDSFLSKNIPIFLYKDRAAWIRADESRSRSFKNFFRQ
jgi:hypothetical protein